MSWRRFTCKRCDMTFLPEQPLGLKRTEELKCICGIVYGSAMRDDKSPILWLIRKGELPEPKITAAGKR